MARKRSGGSGRGLSKSGRRLSDLAESTKYKLNLAVRKVAVNIMNDLAEAGPVYSGDLRDSWIAIPVGTGARGSAGGAYPYSLSDVPQLSTTARELSRATKFTIENTVPHASIALDLETGLFIPPEFEREEPMPGNQLTVGLRTNPGYRGDVEPGGARTDGLPAEGESSAPRDWYVTYLMGGGMEKALQAGISFGFK